MSDGENNPWMRWLIYIGILIMVNAITIPLLGYYII
jgi:hypothetical protein